VSVFLPKSDFHCVKGFVVLRNFCFFVVKFCVSSNLNFPPDLASLPLPSSPFLPVYAPITSPGVPSFSHAFDGSFTRLPVGSEMLHPDLALHCVSTLSHILFSYSKHVSHLNPVATAPCPSLTFSLWFSLHGATCVDRSLPDFKVAPLFRCRLRG